MNNLVAAPAGPVLLFLAGTFLGRWLGALIQRLAMASGYPSSHYYRLSGGRGWLGSLPVLGHFLSSRGARSRRALALELLTGSAWLACWASCPPAKALCGCVLLLGLIGATCIDFDHMIIPDFFTIGLAIAGLVLSAAVPALHASGPFLALNCARSAAAALLGLFIGSGLVLWLGLIGELLLNKEVLGFGDVKFVGAIGAFCGWQGAVFSLFGGALVGMAALVVAAAHRRLSGESAVQLFQRESRDGGAAHFGWGAQFPFGPMLATAAALYFTLLHPWVDRYLNQYLPFF
jgi:leader peptidase (prepilin peptidase)/N-methyltransferase